MENNKLIIADWVNLYGDALYNWAISKTKNKELSEDLIQDTFIAALKSFESFENKSSPKTWLISILNNKIIDYYRKEKTKSLLVSEKNGIVISDLMFNQNDFWVDNEIAPFWEQEKELLLNEKFENELMECCNELPEKWNLALSYKYFSDKKGVEICKELNITATNYWQIIHRSKLVLKKMYTSKMERLKKYLPFLLYSCKRVSEIISKDDDEITLKEKLILVYHGTICKTCQHYKIQSTIIDTTLSKSFEFINKKCTFPN